MAKIKINVTGHLFTVTEFPLITDNNVNVDEIEAEFDESWDGYAKIAVFKKKSWQNSLCTLFDCNNIAKLPDTVGSGKLILGIVGIDSESQITTNIKTISIAESAEFDGIEPPEEDIYTQILDNYSRAMEVFNEKVNGIEDIANSVASLRRYMNFKQVDSFDDGYGHTSYGYKFGNVVIYYIKWFTSSPVSDTNTDTETVIHTIPESVGTPITSAREFGTLDIEKRIGESFLRNVYNDSIVRITEGSRDIKLITATITVNTAIWFLVDPVETGVDIHTHIVDTLPTEGIETNSIYFLESNLNSDRDKYEEYVYINSDWERIGGSAYLDTNINSYSTEERVVGSWLDGKPLYQKTIIDNSTHNLEFEMNTGLTNIDTIYIMQPSYTLCSNNVIYPISYAMNTNAYAIGAFVRSSGEIIGIRMGRGFDNLPLTKIVITLQYTKTSDNAIGNMENPYSYSTNEKIIGKWIDGNLLYQKTIYIDSLPNNSTKNIAHGIANISSIIGIDSYVKWASGGWIADLPWVVSGDDTETITVSAGLSSIQIVTKKDRTSMSAYVTLRYTKTS